jgi:hypothetical protein
VKDMRKENSKEQVYFTLEGRINPYAEKAKKPKVFFFKEKIKLR